MISAGTSTLVGQKALGTVGDAQKDGGVSATMVAARMMARLSRERVLQPKPGEKAFYLAHLGERIIVIFDPLTVADHRRLLSDELARRVSLDLGGLPVFPLGSAGGLYYQIGTSPKIMGERDLESVKLSDKLDRQPTPLHVPIGMTSKGLAWRDIVKLDTVLIVGPRGSGKTTVMHSWIQSLIRGGGADIFCWDNKAGNEFGRYQKYPNVTVAINQQIEDQSRLGETLAQIQAILNQRAALYARYGGAPTLTAYNRLADPADQLRVMVLMVDEVYFMSQETRLALTRLVTIGRAYGLHAVLGCQQATREVVDAQLDANMSTRLVFHVADVNESRVAMGRKGAESLPRVPGRVLFYDGNEVFVAQGLAVDLPQNPVTDQAKPASAVVSILSAEEQKLVDAALAFCDGYFKIADVAQHIGRNPKYVQKFASVWAERGWLSNIRVTADNPPKRLGRRVTRTIVRMAGLEGKYKNIYQDLPEAAQSNTTSVDENG